jgi:hypothetical protein
MLTMLHGCLKHRNRYNIISAYQNKPFDKRTKQAVFNFASLVVLHFILCVDRFGPEIVNLHLHVIVNHLPDFFDEVALGSLSIEVEEAENAGCKKIQRNCINYQHTSVLVGILTRGFFSGMTSYWMRSPVSYQILRSTKHLLILFQQIYFSLKIYLQMSSTRSFLIDSYKQRLDLDIISTERR